MTPVRESSPPQLQGPPVGLCPSGGDDDKPACTYRPSRRHPPTGVGQWTRGGATPAHVVFLPTSRWAVASVATALDAANESS